MVPTSECWKHAIFKVFRKTKSPFFMHSSNSLLLCPNKPQAILITGYADSPLIAWVASQQWFNKGESTREEKWCIKTGGGEKRGSAWHGQMDGQWSVTGPAAHTLTQRDCQIAVGYDNLSMALNVEREEDLFVFFTAKGTESFSTAFSHSVTCCYFFFSAWWEISTGF